MASNRDLHPNSPPPTDPPPTDTPPVRTEPARARPVADLGRFGEDLAAARLEAGGLTILARNWRVASRELRGELDVVAFDPAGGVLVICEVKTRRSDRFGGPLVAVTPRKQARIRALATAFLREVVVAHRRLRFDVIGIVLRAGKPPEITHLQGAF